MQGRTRNTLLYAGQTIYIPDPRVPILGFAAGEEAVLKGFMIDGKYMPTKIEQIDIEKRVMTVHYYGNSWDIHLTKGTEFMTSRRLQIVEVLEGFSGLVPPRVVFELIS